MNINLDTAWHTLSLCEFKNGIEKIEKFEIWKILKENSKLRNFEEIDNISLDKVKKTVAFHMKKNLYGKKYFQY